jgi:5'-3' exonuclease
VHQQNKGVSEEEVIKDVQQAVDEIRAEEYAKKKKSDYIVSRDRDLLDLGSYQRNADCIS